MKIKNRYNTSVGLIKWSLIRHKFYIPVFVLVQILLSVSVIYGFSFVTNAVDDLSKSFLCTGAITINIIAVTCVLCPQIVSEAKQNGIFNYQKTLPVSRIEILLSDLLVWGIISLPGVFISMILGSINFNINIEFGIISVLSLFFVIVSLILFGFSIAYLLPPNVMTLVTQIIMIGGLLFSPIIYSADRLPNWMANIYNYLPFVPVSNIIRFSLFSLNSFNIKDYIVVLLWGFVAFLLSIYIIKKRK